MMRSHGIPYTRENWIACAYTNHVPYPWTVEDELELPEDLQNWDRPRLRPFNEDFNPLQPRDYHGRWTNGATRHVAAVAAKTKKNTLPKDFDMEKAKETVGGICDKFHMPREVVQLLNQDEIVRLNGKEYPSSAAFNPKEKMVKVFASGLQQSPKMLETTLAHEFQHFRFNRVMETFEKEKDAIVKAEGDSSYFKALLQDEQVGADVHAKLKKKYPTFMSLIHYWAHLKDLAEMDGCTGYSSEYWQHFFEHYGGPVNQEAFNALITAIDETLAEMARTFNKNGEMLEKTPEIWKGLYDTVQTEFARLTETPAKKPRKPRTKK